MRGWLRPRWGRRREADSEPGEARLLSVGEPASPSGGSFRLGQLAGRSCAEQLGAGWTAEAVHGSRQLLVRGPTRLANYVDALEQTLSAAQEALDLLSMRGIAQWTLVDTDDDHLVWWTEPQGVTLRVVGVSDLGVSSSVTGNVMDQSGKTVPPPPTPPLPWHESLRYFRLSQVTSDLFDAYRNMYLALEALLSSMVPQHLSPTGQPSEGEGSWLTRALSQVNSLTPLARYVSPGSTDPLGDLMAYLYAGTRTGLFHAKTGRPILFPYQPGSRAQVLSSLERLSRLFLDLFHAHSGYLRASGGMTFVAFDLITRYETVTVVSDDPSEASSSDSRINPKGGSVVRLPTRQAPELSEPGLKVWFGEGPAAEVAREMPVVRRIGLNQDGQLMQVHLLDDALSLTRVQVVQVAIGMRLVNRRQPRFRFPT